MKLAIMQPYFVPYLGYWQLLNLVDRFVIYDDVSYIVRGWVNRNRILINEEPKYITVPLNKASRNKLICDITLQSSPFWRKKILKKIEVTYRKAPFFASGFPLVEKIINYETVNLSDFLSYSIACIADFLSIKTHIVKTSRCYGSNNLSGQDRIIDICKKEGASVYINPHGGQSLYDKEIFLCRNIELKFLETVPVPYKQRSAVFVPYLSVIDVLMEIGPLGVRQHLESFKLHASR